MCANSHMFADRQMWLSISYKPIIGRFAHAVKAGNEDKQGNQKFKTTDLNSQLESFPPQISETKNVDG